MEREDARALLNATALNLGTGVVVVENSHANDDDIVSGIGAPAENVPCEILGFHDGIAQTTDKEGKVTDERSFLVVDLLGSDGAPYRVNIRRLTQNKGLAAKYGFLGKFSAVKAKLTALVGKTFTPTRIVSQMDETLGYRRITEYNYTIG